MSYYNIRATYAIFWNFWNMRLFLNYPNLNFAIFEVQDECDILSFILLHCLVCWAAL